MGPLMPNLGIRQGDHFSPYLFILCAEDLSSRIIEAESRGFIQGCRNMGEHRVSLTSYL